MKEIKLTQGMVALVDDADYEWLSQWKWCFKSDKNGGYAHRGIRLESRRWTTTTMHRQILGLTNPRLFCDHRDGNKLNNQRSNLRICSCSENRMNSLPNKNTSSCYKGVTRRKSGAGDRWISQIRHNQKTIRIGTFDTEKLAALAYNDAAIAHCFMSGGEIELQIFN